MYDLFRQNPETMEIQLVARNVPDENAAENLIDFMSWDNYFLTYPETGEICLSYANISGPRGAWYTPTEMVELIDESGPEVCYTSIVV